MPSPGRFGLSIGTLLLVASPVGAEDAAPASVSAPVAAGAPAAATAPTASTDLAGPGSDADCPSRLTAFLVEGVPVLLDRAATSAAKRAVVDALGACDDPRLEPIWLQLVEDPAVGPQAILRLVALPTARARSALRKLAVSPRTQGLVFSTFKDHPTTDVTRLLEDWATDRGLSRDARAGARELLRTVRTDEIIDQAEVWEPRRLVGTAWGGAMVAGPAFTLLGSVGKSDWGEVLGASLGVLVGAAGGATLGYLYEPSAAEAMRFGTYPTWGLLTGAGWAWALETAGNSAAERHADLGLSLAGSTLGLGAALWDRADVTPWQQARVDYGIGSGMLLGMGLAAISPAAASRPLRWTLISGGMVGGGLLGALQARKGGKATEDRLALGAWPLIGAGVGRFLRLAASGTTAGPTGGWPWAGILPIADPRPISGESAGWAGIGWGLGAGAALVAVGLKDGAPGEYRGEEVLPIVSGSLLGGTMLPLTLTALKARGYPEIWATLGVYGGAGIGLIVAGAADLPGDRALPAMIGSAWSVLAANGVDLMWGDDAEAVHATRVNAAAVGLGYAAGAWLLPKVDWSGADVAASAWGAGYGGLHGWAIAFDVDGRPRRQWAGGLLGSALGSAGAAVVSRRFEATPGQVGGVGLGGAAGGVFALAAGGLVGLPERVQRYVGLAAADLAMLGVTLAYRRGGWDASTAVLSSAGALLGSGVGALGALVVTSEAAGISGGALLGWGAGALTGLTIDKIIARRDARRTERAALLRAPSGARWQWRGLAPLAMRERGSEATVPGLSLEWTRLPPPPVQASLRVRMPNGM